MLGVGGALAELAASGDVVSGLEGRGLGRAAVRVVVAVVAGFGEEGPLLPLVPLRPAPLQLLEQLLLLALRVLDLGEGGRTL